jgi:AAA+ ATPase superfamily predicted ATPase
MLVLSGSQMGIMRRHLLDYDAPLYGRATAHTQLPPLPFATTRQYFPDYDAAERVKLYAMWGGVPAYWERLDADQPVVENLRQNILPAHAWMVDESRILLSDFITDMHNYVGIMRAIADGQQSMGDIARRTGLASGKASFYLSVLRDTGFVTREVPISQRGEDSRRGRYQVTDPYLRFFYRFISAQQSKLALGQIQPLLKQIEEELPGFIEINTWQELCRVWLLLAGGNNALPVAVDEVGSEWAASYTVDVVGVSDRERVLVLGDCFWQDESVGADAIEALVKKTAHVAHLGAKKDEEPDRLWTLFYTAFSKSGWTAAAQRKAEDLLHQATRGRKRWQTAGIQLLDLETLDRDLARWSV